MIVRKAKKKRSSGRQRLQTLRQSAEELLRSSPRDFSKIVLNDIQAIVHDLQVHQIELEMQNEDLRRAQLELTESRDRYSDLYEFAPVGYLKLDEKGRIIESNLTAAAMLGLVRKDLVGTIFRFVGDASKNNCYFHLQAVFAGEEKQVCELDLKKKDGTLLAVRLESIIQRSAAAGMSRCRTAVIDITDVVAARQELERMNEDLEQRVQARTEDLCRRTDQLREREERLRAIMNGAAVALVIVDNEGIIV